MKKRILYLAAIALVAITGCQKELSLENGNTPAEGSLQDDALGDCLPKTVNGVYEENRALVAASNTITVDVNVTRTGSYVVTTDTVNGCYFRGTGIFTATGNNTVTLRGNGTPFQDGTFNYIVSFDSTFCDIQIDVLPAGAGGPANFTLVSGGTPVNCATAVVNGTYVQNAAVNTTNTVTVSVNVTQIGTYSISATGGGMTFTKSGAFTTTGNQTITLNASGTPTTSGANTVTFAAPFATCNFTVNVQGQAVYTVDCPNVVVNGTYEAGTALVSGVHTITIPVTVSTAGAYSITTTTQNGISFSGSGTLATGPGTITLQGSGTPAAAGTPSFSFGTPSCGFTVTCNGAPTVDWRFTVTNAPSTTYQGETDNAILLVIPPPIPLATFGYSGSNVAGTDDLTITLVDANSTISVGETYSTASLLPNTASFVYDLPGATDTYTADPSITGASIVFTVTAHNPVAKTITVTFTGSAKNIGGQTININNGQLTCTYL